MRTTGVVGLLVWMVALPAVLAAAAPSPTPAPSPSPPPMRFQRMDTSGDGVITRDEWRGNDRSFADHDCNGDGVLSGPEVKPGAQPCRRSRTTRLASPVPTPSPTPTPSPRVR